MPSFTESTGRKEGITSNADRKVGNGWRWVALGLGALVFLLLLRESAAPIHYSWIVGIGVAVLAFLYYRQWLLEKKIPSYNKLKEIVRNHLEKEGLRYNHQTENVAVEPLASDYFAAHYYEEGKTFLIFRNILLGWTPKEITDIQKQMDRSKMQQILAEKGYTKEVLI